MGTVHIGIVTYNSLADIPRCLTALRQQTYSPIHIIALDNASTDSTVDWLRAYAPDVHVIVSPKNVGFATAHNEIVSACSLQADDYYMPLNPDAILEPTYIEALVATLEARQAGWVTGKLLLADNDVAGKRHRLYSVGHALRRDGYTLNIGYNLPDVGQFEEEREVFGAPGAAPLISHRLIADLSAEGGLFDEDMFMYAEDTDLDWRARLRGWDCWYTPLAVAFHRGSYPVGKLQAQAIANRYLSVIKNAYLLDLICYNLPIMIAHCMMRLVVTPEFGFHLLARLLRLAIRFWGKRTKPNIARATMLKWFRWSDQQPTGQPDSFAERLKSQMAKASELR